MSEERNTPVSAEELMRRLKSIGSDLWRGATPEEAVERDFAAEAVERPERPAPKEAPAKKTPDAGTERKKMPEKQKPGIENLWITADETVDWTEALLRDTSPDGLTVPKLWNFYHRMAEKVLSGNTEAYAEVLTTLNPLGDLTDFVNGMVLRTPGPDRLECAFECRPEDLESHGRDYLGALSLRIARDLLALLPVEEVLVTGSLEDREKIRVLFRRDQLLRQKMAFLRPADFAEACGGTISLD